MAKGKQVSIGFKLSEPEYKMWKLLARNDKRSLASEIKVTMSEKVDRIIGSDISIAAIEEL